MTNTNEIVNYDQETGEVLESTTTTSNGEVIVADTENYIMVKKPDGTFKKNMKYKAFFSRAADTDEEKIELYKVFNDVNNELVIPMKNMVGKEVSVAHVFMQPYESFDDKTGATVLGVTTTIQDVEGNYYATSSKSVYYRLFNIFQTFGSPKHENYKPVKVKVLGIKQKNGTQIDLELIGLA